MFLKYNHYLFAEDVFISVIIWTIKAGKVYTQLSDLELYVLELSAQAEVKINLIWSPLASFFGFINLKVNSLLCNVMQIACYVMLCE